MTLDEYLAELGFELLQQMRDGTERYARRHNAYLQWWVTLRPDGTAEFTWEFELGAYLKEKGFHVSVQDELSLLIFPKTEARGPADADWIANVIDESMSQLGSVDLLRGE